MTLRGIERSRSGENELKSQNSVSRRQWCSSWAWWLIRQTVERWKHISHKTSHWIFDYILCLLDLCILLCVRAGRGALAQVGKFCYPVRQGWKEKDQNRHSELSIYYRLQLGQWKHANESKPRRTFSRILFTDEINTVLAPFKRIFKNPLTCGLRLRWKRCWTWGKTLHFISGMFYVS